MMRANQYFKLLLPLLGLFMIQVSLANNIPALFNKMKNSVVIVKSYGSNVLKKPEISSGVVISNDGRLLTAAHSVQTARRITVTFIDGTVEKAKIISSEPYADVSLLKVDKVPAKAVVAKLADSSRVNIGEQVFVIGAPYGISHTLSVGRISGRRNGQDMSSGIVLAHFFQTDAVINKGNSGGPMFDLKGDVIGVVSHILSKSGGFEGLGFVVSSNTIKQLLIDKKAFWSGVDGKVISGDFARALNVPQAAGLLVLSVAPSSPAARLGLRAGRVKISYNGRKMTIGGDVILSALGYEINGPKEYKGLQKALSKLAPGDTLYARILRAGKIRKISTKLR